MSELRVHCTNPECGKTLRVPETALGRRIRCPACKQEIRAPGTLEELAALAAQEQFRLHVVKGPAFAGTDIALDPTRPYTFGRADTCTFQLPGPTVSRRHFSLHWVNGHWVLEDLNTTTGTTVNGLTVVNKELGGGELIEVGSYQLKIIAPGKRVDNERGPAPVVVPATDAAPLPLSRDIGSAATPQQEEEERLAQQRLVEALSFTDYSPEHLSQVSSRENRAYTLGLALKLVVLLVGGVGLVVGAAFLGKRGVAWYSDASSRRPRMADSTDSRAAPAALLPKDFLAALEAKDFELAGKLLQADTHDAPVQKAMEARLQSEIAAFNADLLRRARGAVQSEDWKQAERLLAASQKPGLDAAPGDWKPIQDALTLQQTLANVKEAIAQRRWDEANRGLEAARLLAPSDARLGRGARRRAERQPGAGRGRCTPDAQRGATHSGARNVGAATRPGHAERERPRLHQPYAVARAGGRQVADHRCQDSAHAARAALGSAQPATGWPRGAALGRGAALRRR